MYKLFFICILLQSTQAVASFKDKNIFFAKQWKASWSLKSFSKLTIAPYAYTPNKFKWEALALVSLLAGKNLISPTVQTYITKRRPIGTDGQKFGNRFGEPTVALFYTGAYYAHAYWRQSKSSFNKAQFYLENILTSGLFIQVAKIISHQQRPNGADYKSFPSGHAAMAFSLAASISFTHPWYYAVLANLVATGTALARIQGNKHYLHDVMAGALVSYSYAYAIDQKNNKQNKKSRLQPDSIFFSLNKINAIWMF